jgi:hypothetical protein
MILKKRRMGADKEKYAEGTYEQYANLYFGRIPYPVADRNKNGPGERSEGKSKGQGRRPSLLCRPGYPKVPRGRGFIND